ncbi:hypothetical protein GGR10_000535 [Bartonella chomelii]|uniref:Uncharacterized protein n=1 Tax=Bartonella chomelii TaxID=236402 RepID=A0ABR6E2Z8_9HYPH|nr:hypothetical protein [Bartonella chomelii]MBA9082694.1 hypothetical protein [Bartonella chomelii]
MSGRDIREEDGGERGRECVGGRGYGAWGWRRYGVLCRWVMCGWRGVLEGVGGSRLVGEVRW